MSVFNTIGTVKIKRNPSHTFYFWGPIKEISGATLKLLERNKFGDCLCLNDKGIVDVDHRDIEEVQEYLR